MSSDAMKWFKDAKFGMFIHWGLYAVPGGLWKGQEMDYIGEWLQAKYRIPAAEYAELAEQFNPVCFDAEEWILIAKAAGMRYIVFTTKHHEGFAMYHSKVSPFNIVDATPFKRDVLAELAAACEKHGVKLGIYYSQDLDWHEPDGGDPGPTMRNFDMSWGNDWDFPDRSAKKFSRYFEGKVIPQLTELLTNYGPLGVLWFDCPVSISKEECARLAALVKTLQPECLVNTRIGHGFGDYGSLGDNQLPAARREGAWESPGTMNDTWGFKVNDHNWKPACELVGQLVGLADKDTNYLLNVGPGPDGRFPAKATEILQDVGRWLDQYGAGVHGSSGNPFPYDFAWGRMTVSQGGFTRLNLFLNDSVGDSLTLCGLKDRVRRCYDLGHTERDLPFSSVGQVLRIELGALSRDGLLPALAVELDTCGLPTVDQRLIPQNGGVRLMASLGKLQHGELAAATGEQGVGAAGESLRTGTHSRLDDAGALVDWHNPSDSVAWDVVFLEAGHYQVEFVTHSRGHSRPWSDGQSVRLSFGDVQWDVALRGHVTGGGCYAQGVSGAGELVIKDAGEGTFRVRMTDLGDPQNGNMALEEVRLTKIK